MLNYCTTILKCNALIILKSCYPSSKQFYFIKRIFMCKNNFKALLLMTFISVSFSIDLFAMQETAKQNIEEVSSKTEDAFVKEFVDTMKNDKIYYDGKTLTLYAASSQYEHIVGIICCAFFTYVG